MDVPGKTTQKSASRSRRKTKAKRRPQLAMLAPAEDAVVDEGSPEELNEALAKRTKERGYRNCGDLHEAEQRVRDRAGVVRDDFLYLGRVFNDVAEQKLFKPDFTTLNAWIESPGCVLGKSQAHACRRALKLHEKLLAAGKEPLPTITHYRIATEGANEDDWVKRADKIREKSTREAEKAVMKRASNEEQALTSLIRILKTCMQREPQAVGDGLLASEHAQRIVRDVEAAAELFQGLVIRAKGAGIDAGRKPVSGEEAPTS